MARKSTSKRVASAPPVEHLGPETLARVAERFRALGEPTRLALMQEVCKGPRNVGALAQATKLTHANASRHLSVLCAAGFVRREKRGTEAIYGLAGDTALKLCELMCAQLKEDAQHSALSLGL